MVPPVIIGLSVFFCLSLFFTIIVYRTINCNKVASIILGLQITVLVIFFLLTIGIVFGIYLVPEYQLNQFTSLSFTITMIALVSSVIANTINDQHNNDGKSQIKNLKETIDELSKKQTELIQKIDSLESYFSKQ